ncbi:FAD dependent oxidoreductase [Rhodopirellula baltica SH28]|uniref:FAD dependent oxidoreductase n=2 Tax=Rhodopirellula baltica TaxID=265606 RepID=K5DHM9_RHOBT|nr:FAD dependent oxidoreductase [Rhodopirellula baltica SH28]
MQAWAGGLVRNKAEQEKFEQHDNSYFIEGAWTASGEVIEAPSPEQAQGSHQQDFSESGLRLFHGQFVSVEEKPFLERKTMNQSLPKQRNFIQPQANVFQPSNRTPTLPLAASSAPCCGELTAPEDSCCGATEPTSISAKPEAKTSRADNRESLPIAIIGAGPIGLAAAANLIQRDQDFILLEAGPRIAASIWEWRHVRLFTPWSYLIDPASKRILQADHSWQAPDDNEVPFAKELVERYLDPLAANERIASRLKLNHQVTTISRDGHDRMKDGNRNEAPFFIVADTPDGPRRFYARAVIDASGTWNTPNPMGAGGIEADGEQQFQTHIRYGMPDVLDRERDRYAGKRVLVVGSGHSATGAVLSLVELANEAPETMIAWAVRRTNPAKLWGGGQADEIEARGALGTRVKAAVDDGKATLLTGLSIGAINEHPDGLEVFDVHGVSQVIVNEIIVAAGSRPNLNMLRELRLELDAATEATKALGPLIDPNQHSCGSVPPHGAKELTHPERGFYLAGMKSYGRAPTFLMRTGYEQVRSIAAELSGDHEAARKVELTLPSTGVCSTDLVNQERGDSCEITSSCETNVSIETSNRCEANG